MPDEKILHFSFGPVQGFISQARRTRDFWGGSYILSYLAGRAILALEETNGDADGTRTVIFPSVKDDPLMQILRGSVEHDDIQGHRKNVGSLPNRFSARIPDGASGEICEDAIKDAWSEIYKSAFLRLSNCTDVTEKIWKGQVEDVWEFSWCIDEGGKNYDTLIHRKNLRTYIPQPEAGLKCTICGEHEALHNGIRKEKESVLQSVRRFWEKVADSFKGMHIRADGNERLCAVCFTKRVFPLDSIRKAYIPWELRSSFTSTPYLSSVEWLTAVFTENSREVNMAVERFVDAALAASKAAKPELAEVKQSKTVDTRIETEKETHIRELEDRLKEKKSLGENVKYWEKFKELDGDAFFPDGIRNHKEFLPDLPANAIERKRLIKALKNLTDTVGVSPTPFYAFLLMDGDNMGKLLGENGNVPEEEHKEMVSNALSVFTGKVHGIVDEHNGVLVYAGGDDVFAMMPLYKALECASAIKDAYVEAFKENAEHVKKEDGTISAAIVYAHMHVAMGKLINDAHTVLDRIAKDATGRNSFAVRVWKPGGNVITFAKPWVGKDGEDWVNEICFLKDKFKKKGGYSSSFFYRIRELFEILEDGNEKDGECKYVFSDEQKKQLLVAEYIKSTQNSISKEDAEEIIWPLLRLCQVEFRKKREKEEGYTIKTGRLIADGALFLRFLEQKEV